MRFIVYVLVIDKHVATARRVHASTSSVVADLARPHAARPAARPSSADRLAGLRARPGPAVRGPHGQPDRRPGRGHRPASPRQLPARVVQRYVEDMLAAFGLVGWSFGWDHAKRALRPAATTQGRSRSR
jgi:hypothetical protein